MSRGLLPLLAGILLVALLIGGVAAQFALPHAGQAAILAQGETPTPGGSSASPTPTSSSKYPPELAFLSQLTPQQRFDHMGSAQVTFYNPQGQAVVVNATPGQVASVATNTVTLNVNTAPGATAAARTFNVTSTTWVMGRPQQGSLMAVAQGDRVVVYTIGNSDNATAIRESRTMGYHGGMGGGGMGSHDEEMGG